MTDLNSLYYSNKFLFVTISCVDKHIRHSLSSSIAYRNNGELILDSSSRKFFSECNFGIKHFKFIHANY